MTERTTIDRDERMAEAEHDRAVWDAAADMLAAAFRAALDTLADRDDPATVVEWLREFRSRWQFQGQPS